MWKEVNWRKETLNVQRGHFAAERLVKTISSCKVSLAGAFQTGSGAPSVLFS